MKSWVRLSILIAILCIVCTGALLLLFVPTKPSNNLSQPIDNENVINNDTDNNTINDNIEQLKNLS